MFYTICCSFDSFTIPFLWSFSVTKDGLDISMMWYINTLEWVGYVVNVFYLLDILVKFNVAYFNEIGERIYDRKKIFLKYLTWKHFWFDLIITIPWHLLININEGEHPLLKATVRLLGTLRIIRLMKARKVYEQIRDTSWISKKFRVVGRIFRLVVVILLAAHWGGCVWHYIGAYSV